MVSATLGNILPMLANRLHHLVADGHDRVQRGHRFLKDHRDLAAADFSQRPMRDAEDIAVLQPDFTRGHLQRSLRQQPP